MVLLLQETRRIIAVRHDAGPKIALLPRSTARMAVISRTIVVSVSTMAGPIIESINITSYA